MERSIFPQTGFLYRLSSREWYFDEIYNTLIVNLILWLSKAVFWTDRRVIDGLIHSLTRAAILLADVCAWVDRYLIDGFLNLLVAIVEGIGNFARRFQGGKLQYYLFSMLAVILVLFILKTVF